MPICEPLGISYDKIHDRVRALVSCSPLSMCLWTSSVTRWQPLERLPSVNSVCHGISSALQRL